MNAQQLHTPVTQWLHVQTLMDHSHVNVKMVTLEMDKLVQVRMKRLQNIMCSAKQTVPQVIFQKNTVRCQPGLNNLLMCHNCNMRQVG